MEIPKFSVPRHSGIMPSTGERVSWRPYLVGEEKLMLIAAQADDQSAMVVTVLDMLERVTDGGFDRGRHTRQDMDWLLLMVRSVSVEETADVKMLCQHEGCEHGTPVRVDLTAARISGGWPETDVSVSDNVHLVMRPVTVSDYIEHALDSDNPYDRYLTEMALAVSEIHYNDRTYHAAEVPLSEIVGFIESLPTGRFNDLAERYFDRIPEAVMDMEWQCGGCGEDNTLTVRGTDNFFL